MEPLIETKEPPTQAPPTSTRSTPNANASKDSSSSNAEEIQFSDLETFSEAELSRLREESERFASDLIKDSGRRSLAILGKSGAGKTHTAKWLLNCYKSHVHYIRTTTGQRLSRAEFIYWPSLVDDMCAKRWKGYERAKTYDFLVLDDIGTTTDKPWVYEKLMTLMNERLGKKWTVLTSNLGEGELAEIDARIASRLRREGGVVVEMVETKDYNLR